MINFQEYRDFPSRDFNKSLQIVSCTATERHRMKKLKLKLKFHSRNNTHFRLRYFMQACSQDIMVSKDKL